MKRLTARTLGVLLLTLPAAGCFGTGQTGAHNSTPAQIAKQAIEEQTGLDADDVVIHDIEAKDYRDSSLDCPQPGMTYLQVITPGYRVKAQVDDQQFDVRIAGERAVICTKERELKRQLTLVQPKPRSKCTSGPWSGDSNCTK